MLKHGPRTAVSVFFPNHRHVSLKNIQQFLAYKCSNAVLAAVFSQYSCLTELQYHVSAYAVDSWKLSQRRVKNLQWFHAYKCLIGISNSGLLFGSSATSPSSSSSHVHVLWMWHVFFEMLRMKQIQHIQEFHIETWWCTIQNGRCWSSVEWERGSVNVWYVTEKCCEFFTEFQRLDFQRPSCGPRSLTLQGIMNHPLWTVKNVCGHQLLDEKVTDWLAVFGHFCWQKKLERKNTRRKKKNQEGRTSQHYGWGLGTQFFIARRWRLLEIHVVAICVLQRRLKNNTYKLTEDELTPYFVPWDPKVPTTGFISQSIRFPTT